MPRTARSSQSRTSRRELIAEAVIDLLAREGGRGLTHGNIDVLLGLPKGSTSFYFRRRAELFEAGVRRLVDEDLKHLHHVLGPLFEKYPDTIPLREVARSQYVLWRLQEKASMRRRRIARFEFFLHAARDAHFARFHDTVRKAIFELGATMFARLGAKNPLRAAIEYGYLIRGDSMAYFFRPPSIGWHRVTPAYYERCLQEIIDKTNRSPSDLPLKRTSRDRPEAAEPQHGPRSKHR
jgi:AcrR family transcriptional regulator